MAKPACLTSPKLTELGIKHGWFMRTGGTSQGKFSSLNVKKGLGDPDANVDRNRELALQTLGLDPARLVFINHEHETRILRADESLVGQDQMADGLITTSADFVLGHGTADCGTTILADRDGQVLGLLHTGWRSAAAGIIPKMISELGVEPSDLVAGIGPMICGKCYEFGEEVYNHFDDRYIQRNGDKLTLDLKNFLRDELGKAGVKTIDDCGVCTFEDRLFFSHRRDADGKKHTGRFFTVAALPS